MSKNDVIVPGAASEAQNSHYLALLNYLLGKYGSAMTRPQVCSEAHISNNTLTISRVAGILVPMENMGHAIRFRTTDVAKFLSD